MKVPTELLAHCTGTIIFHTHRNNIINLFMNERFMELLTTKQRNKWRNDVEWVQWKQRWIVDQVNSVRNVFDDRSLDGYFNAPFSCRQHRGSNLRILINLEEILLLVLPLINYFSNHWVQENNGLIPAPQGSSVFGPAIKLSAQISLI